MAKSRNNVVTHGLSGMVGGILVFRQYRSGTVVGNPPRRSSKVSEKQAAQRRRFQEASFYAQKVMAEKETEIAARYTEKAEKDKKGKTPYNVALADFLKAPDIELVDFSKYAGSAGDVIVVDATDDFEVVSVTVEIVNENGVVEEGEAAHSFGHRWIYTATQENGSMETTKITVSASDLPGNVTEQELSL
jgi:hypothetical protein